MANKHTSIAGLVYIAAAAFAKIGTIWFPAHTQQFEQTVTAVKELAITYGLVMAGDSARKDEPPPSDPPASPPLERGGVSGVVRTVALTLGIAGLLFSLRK